MKIKTKKNEHGWWKAICPFCELPCRMNYNSNDKSLIGLQRHIKTYAQKEAFALALEEISDTPHLDYYKQHTVLQPKQPVDVLEQS